MLYFTPFKLSFVESIQVNATLVVLLPRILYSRLFSSCTNLILNNPQRSLLEVSSAKFDMSFELLSLLPSCCIDNRRELDANATNSVISLYRLAASPIQYQRVSGLIMVGFPQLWASRTITNLGERLYKRSAFIS